MVRRKLPKKVAVQRFGRLEVVKVRQRTGGKATVARFRHLELIDEVNVRGLPYADATELWREAAIYCLTLGKIIYMHRFKEQIVIDPLTLIAAIHPCNITHLYES